MAIYSFNISNVSRKNGSTSCATLSYISGKKIYDERLGQSFNYGRDERVIYSHTCLPDNAPNEFGDPAVLFNSIEKYEQSANARTGKKIMVVLPKEFDLDTQIKVVDEFIKNNITDNGYACTYAIHKHELTDDEKIGLSQEEIAEKENPHCHILITNRQINDKGEWAIKRKMEYAYEQDENGDFIFDEKGDKKRIPVIDKKTGEQKVDKRGRKQWKRISTETNLLDQKDFLNELRKEWAIECNKHLELENQISELSLKEQGIDREPTIHEGYAAREMEKRNEVSDRCEINRQIKAIEEKEKLIDSLKAEIESLTKQLKENVIEPLVDLFNRFKSKIQLELIYDEEREFLNYEASNIQTDITRNINAYKEAVELQKELNVINGRICITKKQKEKKLNDIINIEDKYPYAKNSLYYDRVNHSFIGDLGSIREKIKEQNSKLSKNKEKALNKALGYEKASNELKPDIKNDKEKLLARVKNTHWREIINNPKRVVKENYADLVRRLGDPLNVKGFEILTMQKEKERLERAKNRVKKPFSNELER